MRKVLLLSLFYLFTFCNGSIEAKTIDGFWKSIDKETGKPECIFAIYEYKGMHYGRIIGIIDSKGEMKDNIYTPSKRAPGVVGDAYYSGLDIIWDLRQDGPTYKGSILDPQKGNIYRAELWTANDKLIVRGKFLFFGRNTVWFPVVDSDFPKDFKIPNINEIVPSIPKPK